MSFKYEFNEKLMSRVLASNQTILWAHFRTLKSIEDEFLRTMNPDVKRRNAFLALITTVTLVETFLNIYFNLLVSEEKYSQHSEKVCNDLKNPNYSLDKKIKDWPKLLFNQEIKLGRGAGQKFQNLKKMRNQLMHFHSDHMDVKVENFRISKLLDVAVYDDLSGFNIGSCSEIVLGVASEIFQLIGVPKKDLEKYLHVWFGVLPTGVDLRKV